MRYRFKSKDEDIDRVIQRLMQYPVIRTDTRTSFCLSKNKYFRFLREKDLIYMGADRHKNKSIIGRPPHVEIERKKGVFIFKIK